MGVLAIRHGRFGSHGPGHAAWIIHTLCTNRLYIHRVIESLIQRLLQHREHANIIRADKACALVGQEFGK